MTDQGETPKEHPPFLSRLTAGRSGCVVASTVIAIAFCVSIVVVWLKTLETVQTIATGLQQPFLESNIQETFQSTAFKTSGTEGGILEVATANTTEVFERKSEISLFDRILPLGTTVSEIQVPAFYRYHIDLNGAWKISSKQGKCIVIAPEIKPSLPVAFDTGEMKSKTASGWARWDKHENLKILEQSLTDKLAKKAALSDNIERVREEARLSVAKFVKNWLVRQEHWSDERFTEIIVLFPDEIEKNPLPDQPLPPPTLRLNEPAPTTTPPSI